MRKQCRIIIFLDHYWNKNNVFFGKLIHDLKPQTKQDWNSFLKDQNYFFIKNMHKYGFKTYEHKYWIWYIVNSFWKLYVSETIAIKYFKNHGIELKFTTQYLDAKYGFDFKFKLNSNEYYIIVKHGIYDFAGLAKFKLLPQFKFIILFDSATANCYKYDSKIPTFDPFDFASVTQPLLSSAHG